MSAALGANVGLAGISGVVSEMLTAIHPILQTTLLALQVLVAGFTAWFIWRKIAELDKCKTDCPLKEGPPAKRKASPAKKRKSRSASAGVILISAVLFLFGGGGCGSLNTHVRPGFIQTSSVMQKQPQDPKSGTTLKTEFEQGAEYVLPAGSTVKQVDASSGIAMTFTLSTNMPVKTYTREKVDSGLGAADLSVSKMIAKLKSVRWIQGVGVLVFLFGVASFAYPPLRLLVGSITTSIVIGATGLALIVLPILVVGHEVMILVACLGAGLGYLFLHRYGKKSGENEVLRQIVTKKWVDENGDGLVQPTELKKVE